MDRLGGLIHRMPLYELRRAGRLRRDLRAAAVQRLRLGMADLPGRAAEPGPAAMGAQDHGAGGRRHAGAVGRAGRGLLRQGVRHHLSRAAAQRRRGDRRRKSTAFRSPAMFALAALCLLAGILPGLVIDALSPIAIEILGGRMPLQANEAWLSIAPIAESRSSYNGLLVFVFIAISASLAVFVIHRFASHALRRGPAWGCGFPDPVPPAQYSARQLCAADPPRLRHTGVSRARACRHAPPRRYAARAASPRTARSDLGRNSTRRSRAASALLPTGSTSAVPHHPPLSQPGFRDARRAASGARDMA